MRLCLLLAFQSLISHGKNAPSSETTRKIVALARLMDKFCDEHIGQTFPGNTTEVSEKTWETRVDSEINLHIEALKNHEMTQLPEDRETLIKFYDRLQQRKARRKQRQFYAESTTKQLADLVLKCLDEEIEDRKTGGYQ